LKQHDGRKKTTNLEPPLNTVLELTPQAASKIGYILKDRINRSPSRSIGAAQLSAKPLSRRHP
jgi:hypothetical protein